MALRPETLNYYVERTRDILIDVAKGNRTDKLITYKELMNEMGGGPGRGYIAEVLDEVSCSEHARGHPLLSALAVHSIGRTPGYGFWYIKVLPQSVQNSSDADKRVFWQQECDRVWKYWQQH
jgi:hypothetical protein